MQMCINRAILPDGTETACRRCWQCLENRINDWVGRGIAEAEVSAATNSVTLTYRPKYEELGAFEKGAAVGSTDTNFKAQILCYSDIQLYLKRLRKAGFPCRYIVAGEYGAKKGRCHWHIILFWKDAVPEHPLRENFEQEHWPHGHSFWDESSPAALKYCLKYIQKNDRDARQQREFHMSKMPPLGAGYFVQLAGNYVKQGLVPNDASYSFSDVRGPDGRARKFWLQRQSLDLFLQSFVSQWVAARGGHPPSSPLLSDWYDKQAALRADMGWKPEGFVPRAIIERPTVPPEGGLNIEFSEGHNSFYCDVAGKRLFWSFDEQGERAWRSLIISEKAAALLRRDHESRVSGALYRESRDGREVASVRS